MKLFKSIKNWIFSEERKQMLQVINSLDELSNKLNTKVDKNQPVFLSKRRVGKNTIVVLADGTILTKEEDTPEVYDAITCDLSALEIRKLLATIPVSQDDVVKEATIVKEEEEKFLKSEKYDSLRNHPDFTIDEGRVYFKGVKLAIPPVILASFLEIVEKQKALESTFLTISEKDSFTELEDSYSRLSSFWLKLANSPIKDIDNVLLFCRTNDVRLSPTGNLIAYRRIVTYKTTPIYEEQLVQVPISELDNFVVNAWAKVKKWKKSPLNYDVYKVDGKYTFVEYRKAGSYKKKDNKGSLNQLHTKAMSKKVETKKEKVKIGEEVLYTSWHNKGVHTFKIGDVYKISDSEVDTNVGNCASGGLHAASKDYNYEGFGDTPVVVLINPSKAIYVPTYETGKFRTSEMKIACVNPYSHGTHVPDDLIAEADKEYNDYTIEELETIVRSKQYPIVDGLIPEITIKDTRTIVDILKEKVVKI